MKSYTMKTIGCDISDRDTHICVLDNDGQIVLRKKIKTTQKALNAFFGKIKPCTVVIEVGTHSRWISELLKSKKHNTIIANPRMLKLIYNSKYKDDRMDAEKLARVARVDPKLLGPIEHRGQEQQLHLLQIKARDQSVQQRTATINAIRGWIKSFGFKLPQGGDANHFHKKVQQFLQQEVQDRAQADLLKQLQPILHPMIDLLELTTQAILLYDKRIEEIAKAHYPVVHKLRQIDSVGPITALAFVLSIEKPERFKKARDVGAYLGLVPRRFESGQTKQNCGITKAGDRSLRCLLVNCAQRILGPHGKDCDLKRFGERLAERAGKKKAVVAVARKLAVLMLSLWKSGQAYQPLRVAEDAAA